VLCNTETATASVWGRKCKTGRPEAPLKNSPLAEIIAWLRRYLSIMQKIYFMPGKVLMMIVTGPIYGKRPATKEACYNYFRELIGAKNGMHMSVIDKNDDTVKGIFCITRINPLHGTFELTDINWTPALKKTRISTEAIYLVLAYFIDALHYRRCEWRTNIFNDGAIKAAERFGFRKEGILRDKKVTKGHSEDLALFSIIASEWHDLEIPIKAWLRENNFDGLGRQLKKLKDFR
jgi:RimJ/RimL family protein N-acetyltransferase